MKMHALVMKSGGVESGAVWVARLRYFAAVLLRCQRTNGLYRVKAASILYPVPRRGGAYVVSWAYVSDWSASCLSLLKGLFPLCSFSASLIAVLTAAVRSAASSLVGGRSDGRVHRHVLLAYRR